MLSFNEDIKGETKHSFSVAFTVVLLCTVAIVIQSVLNFSAKNRSIMSIGDYRIISLWFCRNFTAHLHMSKLANARYAL